MAQTMTVNLAAYRIPIWGEPDPRWQKCFTIAATIGVLTLAAVYLVPQRAVEITSVDQVSDRLAKLILEEPAPPAAAPKPKAEVLIETPPASEVIATPEPKPKPVPVDRAPQPARRARAVPKVPETSGQAGREQAREQVTKQLASVKTQLATVLADVSSSLASETKSATKKSTRRRRTRAGRNASQLASMAPAIPIVDPSAASSRVEGTSIAIESIQTVSGMPGSDTDVGGAVERSQIRSDAQLLAVVRKYAPGIQFCYDNELKKTPGLGGKLLVSITVAASGRVTDATIVQDTVGAAGLQRCALSQIEAWRFPKVAEGVVAFQAPFVFTPPE